MRKLGACLATGMIILYAFQRDAPPVYREVLPGAPTEMGTLEFPVDESSAAVESELQGKIKVDSISVELLVGGFEFNIDTMEPFSPERPGEQIQSPAIRVANHSMVPVKVEIPQVAKISEEDVRFSPKLGSGPEQKFQLLDKVSKMGSPGIAVLVLGASGVSYSSEADFEQYALPPGRRDIFVARIEANGSIDLNLYGKISPDFYGEYEFTVSPTLKISTVNVANWQKAVMRKSNKKSKGFRRKRR